MNRVAQLMWLQTPLRVARLWPSAGVILGDGHYLLRWLAASLLAGPVAGLLGLTVGAAHPGETYTRSLALMVVLALVGQAGAALGLWTTVGYGVGDLLLHSHTADLALTGPDRARLVWLPLLLSYVVLGLLTVLVPLSVLGARFVVLGTSRLSLRVKRLLEFPLALAVGGVLAYVWTQAVPLLIRPVFVWPGGQPSTEDIAPLQQRGWLLALSVTVAVVTRIFLERTALRGRAAAFSQVLWAGLSREIGHGPRPGPLGYVAVGAAALGSTLLLSGLIESYVEAIVVLVFFVVVLLGRRLLLLQTYGLVRALGRVPVIVRLTAGLVIGYYVSHAIVSAFWLSTQTFMPVLAGSCVTIALVTFLTLSPPAGGEDQPAPSEPGTRR
jgi:hypothetical protein